jgi:hypothetical protein
MMDNPHNINKLLQAYLSRIGSSASVEMILSKIQATNPEQRELLLSLLQEKQERIGDKCASRIEFVQKHHRNHKNEQLTFENRHALLELYKDESPHIIVEKCVQIGVSEFAVVDCLYNAFEKGWHGAYVLPKSALRNKLVAERIDKPLLYVDYYKKNLGTTNNLQMKNLGSGSVYFLGSNSDDEFISFPADFVIVDELDRCDQQNIQLVPDRLKHSDHKYTRYISNPTIEGYGIDEKYRESDQKLWMIRCTACNTWQHIEWFTHVVQQIDEFSYELRSQRNPSAQSTSVLCIKCDKSISRLGKGRWAKHNEASSISGYRFSQIFFPTVTITELWEEFKKCLGNETRMQIFYNSNLGLPYKASGSKFSEELLHKNQTNYYMPYEYASSNLVCMGIDVGKILHCVIREESPEGFRLLFAGTFTNFEEIAEYVNRFTVQCVVIDSKPELHKVKELQEKYPYVWLADYIRADSMNTKLIHEDNRTIKTNRTASIDAIFAQFQHKALPLPLGYDKIDNGDYVKHLCASTRIFLPEKGVYEWVHVGPDHYLHAEVYCAFARHIITGNEPHVYNLSGPMLSSPSSFHLDEVEQSQAFSILSASLASQITTFFSE